MEQSFALGAIKPGVRFVPDQTGRTLMDAARLIWNKFFAQEPFSHSTSRR
jgi:hypothetical protein